MDKSDSFSEMEASLFAKTEGKVQGGPFKDMILARESSWYGGQILPKLLGVYEAELAGDVERIIWNSPEVIINVGCAEGYYVIGFARRLPTARIHAFDIDIRGLQVCELAAKANHIENEIYFQTEANEAALAPILKRSKKTVLFVDCEGAERQLFENISMDLLRSSIIIIECHDFIDEDVTAFLEQRLLATHMLHFVHDRERASDDIDLLRTYPEDLRALAVSEERPVLMHWLCAYPREQAS